jgi:molybdopterin molybdotransferase
MVMKSAQEALELLLQHAQATQSEERVPLQEGLGRVLAHDLTSPMHVPPMDNTQMDGYAVRAQDVTELGTILDVSQRIPAGKVGQALAPHTAARIFTGASIPLGADAVLMQEDCESLGEPNSAGVAYQIRLNHVPQAGEWIRQKGEDIAAQSVILTQGTFLQAPELGVAASVGTTHLTVKKRIKVALFFTGDELTLPGQALKPGGIYNSNRDTLIACVRGLGCEFTDFGIVPDTLESTRKTLRQAALEHDLIVTSGGVSVGEEDHIKPAVSAEGHLDMWQIAIKPGKPLAFGSINQPNGKTWFMGLPGNPVASLITFLLFVKPFILKLQGQQVNAVPCYPLIANFDWLKPDKRNEFLRVRRNAQGSLELFHNQSSGVLTSAVWADGLADIPGGQVVRKGDIVSYIPLRHLLQG